VKLKVIKSGENVADGDAYAPTSCSQCCENVPAGGLLLLVDDKEYFPTFCVRCTMRACREIADRGLSEQKVDLT